MKIGIFDDHSLICFGLTEIIKKKCPSAKIIFAINKLSELLDKLEQEKPDILILDILTPDNLGLQMFEKMTQNFSSIKIIAHSALSSLVLVENLLSMNVKGFINKRQPEDDIIEAIKQVDEGEIYLPDEYKFFFKQLSLSRIYLPLTEREKEILKLIAKELTSSDIARNLDIAENTVENHRKNIFQKLKVRNLAGLIMEATRLGYLS